MFSTIVVQVLSHGHQHLINTKENQGNTRGVVPLNRMTNEQHHVLTWLGSCHYKAENSFV